MTEREGERQRRLSGSHNNNLSRSLPTYAAVHATAPALQPLHPLWWSRSKRRDSGKMLSWGCLLALSLAALTGKKGEKSFPSFSLKPASQSHRVLSSKAPSERQRRSGIRSECALKEIVPVCKVQDCKCVLLFVLVGLIDQSAFVLQVSDQMLSMDFMSTVEPKNNWLRHKRPFSQRNNCWSHIFLLLFLLVHTLRVGHICMKSIPRWTRQNCTSSIPVIGQSVVAVTDSCSTAAFFGFQPV